MVLFTLIVLAGIALFVLTVLIFISLFDDGNDYDDEMK